MLRKVCGGLLMLVLLSSQVLAVPSLELYSPDGQFDMGSESWLSTANPFELWVVGTTSPSWVTDITDVALLVAVSPDCWDPDVEIHIDSIASSRAFDADLNPVSFSATLTAANLASVDGGGNPVPSSPDDEGLVSGNFPNHDVYPAYFWYVPLPDLMVALVQEDVYDFGSSFDPDNLPPSAPDVGDVQYYQVSYSGIPLGCFFEIDLTGTIQGDGASEERFAPFSHDARAEALPEPSTVILLGLSLAGMGLFGRRKREA